MLLLQGSRPISEGKPWMPRSRCIATEARLKEPGKGRPVVSLEQMAALYPAAGPRGLMQRLWDSAQSALNGPVVVLIPVHIVESRTYSLWEGSSGSDILRKICQGTPAPTVCTAEEDTLSAIRRKINFDCWLGSSQANRRDA
jgi:hypothetical protein